jgi:hypothetical protein
MYYLFLSVAQVRQLLKSYVFKSILTTVEGYLLRTKFFDKHECYSIERWVLEISIDADGINGEMLALKGNLYGLRTFQKFQLFVAHTGVLLKDVEDHSIHLNYYAFLLYYIKVIA